ncbi:MAG: transketolase [Acidimicrobiales bacterium]
MEWKPLDLAPDPNDRDAVAVTALRMLAVDGVEKANSGHPGLPLGMAPAAWTLWSKILRFDPSDTDSMLRDRFVLSAGHGSMLLYSLLHLFGFDLTLDDLRSFRQLGSRTPGHPEHGMTSGVETSTGPLGQGIGNAVGFAIGARIFAEKYAVARDDLPRVFALCSDGDLMEGISNEASSLAGHLGLSNLVVLYDNNSISIDGSTALAFTEHVSERYSALGWRTLTVSDGNDLDELESVLHEAVRHVDDRPTFISIKSTIGFGAPDKEGTSKVHGSPLGAQEMTKLRSRFGWPDETFYIPEEVRSYCQEILAAKRVQIAEAVERNAASLECAKLDRQRDLGPIISSVSGGVQDGETVATRVASKRFLSEALEKLPNLLVGTADLAESTGLDLEREPLTAESVSGDFIHYGVREHAMGAVMNGLALFGGFKVAGSTFLVFSDYMRGSIRLAALMGLPVTYVFTHDSVAVGEDGPTHEPVEQVTALRIIPNLTVLRPADARETVAAWKEALSATDHPTALILTRQGLVDLGPENLDEIARYGARVVGREQDRLDVVLVASGSEVALTLEAKASLESEGYGVRAISMPCRERFLALDGEERQRLIPAGIPVVSIEAGVTLGWREVVGQKGVCLGISTFGHSGKGPDVLRAVGMTAEAVIDAAHGLLNPA